MAAHEGRSLLGESNFLEFEERHRLSHVTLVLHIPCGSGCVGTTSGHWVDPNTAFTSHVSLK
jgi:hypothetical protein